MSIPNQVVISALRRLWMRDPNRYKCLSNARKSRGIYVCALCKNEFGCKEVQVDHIQPIGKFTNWEQFIIRLFCELDNLQVLCKGCHKTKGKEDRSKQ